MLSMIHYHLPVHHYLFTLEGAEETMTKAQRHREHGEIQAEIP